MKPQPIIHADRHLSSLPRHPMHLWSCVYGEPNGSHDGKITYSAAVRFGPTRRRAIAKARAAALERMSS